MHGGKTPRSVASANYKHGKYSSDLPTKLAADYQAAISDPEIHTLTHEIGVIEARHRMLLRRAETSDLGHAWQTLATDLEAFLSAPDEATRMVAQRALERTVRRGQQDYLLWQSIQEAAKLLGSLRLQEHKRLIDLQLVMTEPQVLQLIGEIKLALHAAVMAHVEAPLGRKILAAVQDQLQRFTPQMPVQAHTAPSERRVRRE